MIAACAASEGWRLGSHVPRSDGTFWHGTTFISLNPLQRRLLRVFCSRAGELIRRDDQVEEV